MDDYISITTLSDFIFCPYSIYLHGIYGELDKDAFLCSPQKNGCFAHEGIDSRTHSLNNYDIMSITVYSELYKLVGKIDLYDSKEQRLVEYKYSIKTVTDGMKIQLWAQMICLKEMGYNVKSLELHSFDSGVSTPISLPSEDDIQLLKDTIKGIRSFDPVSSKISANEGKCRYCIYSGLCNKTSIENVYN